MADANFEFNDEVPDSELARRYFLNRALVAESLARTYEAEADLERGFERTEYLPAILGLAIATAVAARVYRYGPNDVIWILEIGAGFVSMFWCLSTVASRIARTEKRRLADKFRDLARSLKDDASS